MGKDVNFDNGDQSFNIFLDTEGDLSFRANGKNGDGDRRMVIFDLTNQVTFDGTVKVDADLDVADTVTIGGSGVFGGLQLKASDDDSTIFLGSSEFTADVLVGNTGRDGHVQVFDDEARATIDLRGDYGILTVGTEGQDGDIIVLDTDGQATVNVNGDGGRVQLKDGSRTTVSLDGSTGYVTVGAVGSAGEDGTIDICDSAGNITIRLSGDGGLVECDDLDDTGVGSRAAVRPVGDALARVLELQAVSYRTAGLPRIGLLGGDVEAVCPELVTTVAEGRTAVSYSRLAALLVEAVKEQQQLIDRQAAVLAGLLERLGRLDADAA